jgi:lysine-arginine-ornithine-binding protein
MKSALTLAATLALFAGASQAQDTIRIATEGAFPPFNSVNADGELVGFEVDLAEAVCAEAGLTCELVVQDFDGMIPGLLAERFDVIMASMNITEAREEVIDFSMPYYQDGQQFVAAEGMDFEISVDGLSGKVIGVVSGTIHENYVNAEFGDVADVQTYQDQNSALQDLISGRIDTYIDGGISLAENLLATDEGAGFAFVGEALRDPEYFGIGVGAGVREGEAELLATLNAAIEAVHANGTYDEIQANYFSVDLFPN